jgi:hypothetical protein
LSVDRSADSLSVLWCLPERPEEHAALRTALTTELRGDKVRIVGPRPGKEIDPLLAADRVVVVGTDADLAAVVRRLQRRDVLADVTVGFAAARPTDVTALYGLPAGPDGVRVALHGDPDPVPIVRDDVGGLIVGRADITPIAGTVYVDENRVLGGQARALVVIPHRTKGLELIVVRRRLLGFGRRNDSHLGRATQIGSTLPMNVVSDGVPFARTMDRWTFYRHTEPLRLIRGVV